MRVDPERTHTPERADPSPTQAPPSWETKRHLKRALDHCAEDLGQYLPQEQRQLVPVRRAPWGKPAR